jgi:hypothetical protein
MTTHLNKTNFTDFFISENGLDEGGFKEWVLYPGMLFKASGKWWGDRGRRSTLHEGLDFCLYRDGQDRIHQIDAGMKVPVLYDGAVVGIVNDFIGRSIIIKHYIQEVNDREFITVYGHTVPNDDICIGRTVGTGEVIAAVAGLSESVQGMSPHLHISIGIPVSETISYDDLDWDNIEEKMTLIDPLKVIDRYSVVRFSG